MFRLYSSPFFLLPRHPLSLSTSVCLFSSDWLWGPFSLLEARALFRDIRVFRVPWLRETKGQQWAQTRSQPHLLLCYNFLAAFLSSSPPFSLVPSFSTTSLNPSLSILRLWIRWDTRPLKGYFGGWKSMHSLFSCDRVSYRGRLLLSVCLSLSIYISRFISAFRSFSCSLAKRRIETSVFTWTQRGHKESEICIESCSTYSPRDPVVFGHHETQEAQVESSPQDFGRR